MAQALQNLIFSDAALYYSTSVRWIGALSMIITKRGSGYKLQHGKILFSIKFSNSSAENDPCTIFHVMKPLIVYAEHRDQHWEHPNGWASREVTPTGTELYFLSAVCSFAANSSMNMNYSAVHPDNLLIHSVLNLGFCCAAHSCIYKSIVCETGTEKAGCIVPSFLTTSRIWACA